MEPLGDVSAFEHLPDPVVLVAADGTVAWCSRLAARLLGVEGSALTGLPAAEALVLVDETGAAWWDAVRPLDADPRLHRRVPPRDALLRTPGGRTRPVTLSANRVADDRGGLTHLVLVLRRADTRARLEAASSDLVSTVSHEIRSPLTSVKGFVKTLLAKWDRFTDEQKRHMLFTVHEDADRVTRLLGELLDVSRIDAGRLQLRRQMVAVPALATRVVERLRSGDDGPHEIVTALGSDVPDLYADPDKLEQIFTNLVENAVKYGDGEIRIAADVRPDTVEFMVVDQGPGIPSDHLALVFTKFFRRAGERRSGTGLGLYITKGIVEAHGGRIWATNDHGGASLHFTLPRGGLELAGIELPTTLMSGR